MNPPPLRNPHWQRRCAAFLIDFGALATAALVVTAPWWRTDLRDADAAIDGLRATMDATMANALGSGADASGFYASLLSDPALRAAVVAFAQHGSGAIFTVAIAYALLSAAWNIGGELSPWQGSPGKHLLGLRVVDVSGRRAPFAQLLVRQIAAGLSWLTFNLGHLLAWWPPFRSLHDRIAGTDVVATTGSGPARVALDRTAGGDPAADPVRDVAGDAPDHAMKLTSSNAGRTGCLRCRGTARSCRIRRSRIWV
ncbi:MAG: RDD family protein [Xanthomonadales bacterium]|nr:RDD family protein [Xanthomonadales bacterium]